MSIYKDEWDVNVRLAETFGVTRDQLIQVVREVVGARADAVDNDPISAAGLFAYIHGTRNVRALFRSRGWVNETVDNIPLVKNPDRPLMVSYQSVDLACSDFHTPQAISGKGAGAERVIDEAQGWLFSPTELPPSGLTHAPIDRGLWHFCVSVVDEDVRAEFSLSSGISGGNFKGFLERIFIVGKGEWDSLRVTGREDGEAVEFEPVVRRK
jgi:hypothetical protein